jgi:hypothetical protein
VVPTATLQEHVVQRELASQAPADSGLFRFRAALQRASAVLSFAPHTGRRPASHRESRGLAVPFGQRGCVALFAVRDADRMGRAVRNPHEHDDR